MVSKETVRRVGIERCQSRVEAEPRRAVGTQDRVRLAHIDVDVRVVLRWRLADAHEFLHPDADFRDAAVVFETDSRRRTSTHAVVIGGDLDNPLPRLGVGLVSVSMMPSLLVVARTAPATEDGVQLGSVKRPHTLENTDRGRPGMT